MDVVKTWCFFLLFFKSQSVVMWTWLYNQKEGGKKWSIPFAQSHKTHYCTFWNNTFYASEAVCAEQLINAISN